MGVMGAPGSGNTPFDYEISVSLVINPRENIGIDITQAELFMEIYEHMEKPYLTGRIMFIDNTNLYESINFMGTESIAISITFPNNDNSFGSILPYEKVFNITKIEQQQKANDNVSVITMQIVENSFFFAKTKMLNKSYEGKPNEIIATALNDTYENFSRTLEKVSDEVQEPFRFITPHWSVMKLINHLLPMCTSEDGMPFYAFSNLGNPETITWGHLGDFMNQGANSVAEGYNSPREFIYSVMASQTMDDEIDRLVDNTLTDDNIDPSIRASLNRRKVEKKVRVQETGKIIQRVQQLNSYDLLKQIERGHIGSEYYFMNIKSADDKPFRFSQADAVSRLSKYFPPSQTKSIFDDESFNLTEKRSRQFTMNYASNIYTNDFANGQDLEIQNDPIRRTIASSLRSMMAMGAIQVTLPGFHFFKKGVNSGNFGNRGTAAGRNIYLKFLNNDFEQISKEGVNLDDAIDKKNSGSYLIYSCRHIFDGPKYTVDANCVKFSELRTDALTNTEGSF